MLCAHFEKALFPKLCHTCLENKVVFFLLLVTAGENPISLIVERAHILFFLGSLLIFPDLGENALLPPSGGVVFLILSVVYLVVKWHLSVDRLWKEWCVFLAPLNT